MELKGSKTEKNLRSAFSGESEARSKYSFFASVARKEGYEQIAEIFEITADNEREHAKLWFKALGALGNTEHNLKNAAAGEHYEWSDMYKQYAAEAREEGFNDIAEQMEKVAKIESSHEERYNKLISNIQNSQVFKKTGDVHWICRKCGFNFVGKNAPQTCPVCAHPQSYFEIKADNY